MGQQPEQRPKLLITVMKIWVIRVLIGSSVAMLAKKIDTYLDEKYGPNEYDKAISQVWDVIKEVF
jgi:hypothetical protein